MKNIILIISSTIIGVLTLMIVMTINGRMNRSMELQSNVSSVIEETLENATLTEKYSIHNTNEFLADMTEELSVILDSNSDIIMEILQCDKERGILNVKVTASFLHPNGKTGTVVCEKNVILNKLQEPETPKHYLVEFIVEDKLYKKYSVLENNIVNIPAVPQGIGGTFYGWIDENGNAIDLSIPVTRNIVCYADMR